jgi:hypothetical protein
MSTSVGDPKDSALGAEDSTHCTIGCSLCGTRLRFAFSACEP